MELFYYQQQQLYLKLSEMYINLSQSVGWELEVWQKVGERNATL